MLANILEDTLWIISNDKEAEYEFFCVQNNLNPDDEMSMRFFVNEETSNEKQGRADFFSNGFFVSWKEAFGTCKVSTKNPLAAAALFKLLNKDKKIHDLELCAERFGEVKRIKVGDCGGENV